jgi:GntR family transcriptional repressor for pyruvate dehydrogenase complex
MSGSVPGLTPVERTAVYQSVVRQIRDLILDGVWPPGHTLPSERDMAEQLRVGRTSVREALRILEAVGVVENRSTSGRSVTKDIENTILLSDGLERISSAESLDGIIVYQARQALEPVFAALAAQHASREGIQAAGRALAGMERSIDRGRSAASQDRAFHLAVAETIGNPVLVQIERTLINLGKDAMAASLARPGRALQALEEHRTVLEAIGAKDTKRAEEAMRLHLGACEKQMVLSMCGATRQDASTPGVSVIADASDVGEQEIGEGG